MTWEFGKHASSGGELGQLRKWPHLCALATWKNCDARVLAIENGVDKRERERALSGGWKRREVWVPGGCLVYQSKSSHILLDARKWGHPCKSACIAERGH
jgi:hypothetical protein